MLLDGGNGDVVVARVTSRQVQTMYDVKLIEWKQALTFAAIGCTIAQVGNITKNACRTAVGCFNDRRLIEGQSKDSMDMGFCLMCSAQTMRPHHPADTAIELGSNCPRVPAQLDLQSPDGKCCRTDCANTKNSFPG